MKNSPLNNNLPRRGFLTAMPLAAAGFVVLKTTKFGADPGPAPATEAASTRHLNRWHEALRPTARFEVLDGDWQLAEGVMVRYSKR